MSLDADYSTSTARALIRCTRKGCRTAHTLDFATTLITRAYEGRMAQSREVTRGEYPPCPYTDRYDLRAILLRGFECSACGGSSADFDVIRGTFSESVKCGARCRNAVGPSCECQCGGENHATGHAAL